MDSEVNRDIVEFLSHATIPLEDESQVREGRQQKTDLSKMKIQTGDVFLVWRIRLLEQEGRITVQGEWTKGWKEIEVKLPSGELFE